MAGGVESNYVERRDDIPYGDVTHTIYSFNSNVQERTLASLQHGAGEADVEAVQPLVRRTISRTASMALRETAAEHAEEYELGALQEMLLDFGPRSDTIALTYKEYLKVLETRKEEQAMIRNKGW